MTDPSQNRSTRDQTRGRHPRWLTLLGLASLGCIAPLGCGSSPAEPIPVNSGGSANQNSGCGACPAGQTCQAGVCVDATTTTGASSVTSGAGGSAATTSTTAASTSTSSGGATDAGAVSTTTDATTSTTGAAGSSTTTTTGAGGGGSVPDPVSCSLPLADRVTTTEVAVSPSVSLRGGSLWGSTGLPVMFATSPNGGAQVGWSDGSNVHVTPLTASGERAGDDWTVPGSEVRGLVAHDDGAALLAVDGDQMVFVRLDAAGAVQVTVPLVGNNSHGTDGDRWIDDWPHNGRLAWSGTQYAAYFGQTGNHGAAGDHQGDHYSILSADGNLEDGGWDWGCSHSLDERLVHNGNVFAPVCTSDTYPGAGIWFRNRVEISNEPSITNVGGGTKLGGLVPAADGFYLNFASPAQGSSWEVVFLHVSEEGDPSGQVTLTDTPDVDEQFAHLAAYGDGLLAGWGEDTDLTLAMLDTSGNILEGPVAISAQAGGLDDFSTYPSGDVGWAFAGGDSSTLQITRVARCE